MLISYNWLKKYIPNIPNEDEIGNLITFHICELEDQKKLENGDTIFDIKILPDRAHDLLSHYGVASEIAGLLGLEIKNLESLNLENIKSTNLNIKIESSNCRRYMGRIIKGVKVGPSPHWMVELLESIGQRSINNIVDATNFVLFDIGHPIHAFDLNRLSSLDIIVRNATEGDTLTLVGQDKVEVRLKDTDLMITDGLKNLAVAGVKGGLESSVLDETVNLLIEVANFDPISTRKTSRHLSVLSDASKRYENDLPLGLANRAMDEICFLIKEMCSEVTFEEIVDIYPDKLKVSDNKVSFNSIYISKILGIDIKSIDIAKILKNYNYEFTQNNDDFEVTILESRIDITGPHDFVEEIGRVYGYHKIVPHLPKFEKINEDNLIWKKICLAKRYLINNGYKEVMTSVFCDKGEIEILATALGKNFLRTNISDGLRESISFNQKNLPILQLDELKVFEIGAVFKNDNEEIVVSYGNSKNIHETSLELFIKDTILDSEFNAIENYLISLSSSYILNDKEDFLNIKNDKTKISTTFLFKPWSVYPFITRDIAVWVPNNTKPDDLIKIYKEFGTELLVTEPKLFDSFTKDNKTSYAFRLVFQSYEKTLTDEEINGIMSHINEKILSLNWKVR